MEYEEATAFVISCFTDPAIDRGANGCHLGFFFCCCCCVQHTEREQATHHLEKHKRKEKKERREGESQETIGAIPLPAETERLYLALGWLGGMEAGGTERLFVCVSFNGRSTQRHAKALCCLFLQEEKNKPIA